MFDKPSNRFTISSSQRGDHPNILYFQSSQKLYSQPSCASLPYILEQLAEMESLSQEQFVLSKTAQSYNKLVQYFKEAKCDMESELALHIGNRIQRLSKKILSKNRESFSICRIRQCQDIISKALLSPSSIFFENYRLFLMIAFSRGIGGYTLMNEQRSNKQPFPALPSLNKLYHSKLSTQDQVSIQILIYLTSTLIKLDDLKSDIVRQLVKKAFKFNETSQLSKEAVNYFYQLEMLARKIFQSSELRPLRALFYEDFKMFNEISTAYGLFLDEENSLLKMLVVMTKFTIGLQFSLQEINPKDYAGRLTAWMTWMKQGYAHLRLPFLLLELTKCRNRSELSQVKGLIENNFSQYAISKEISKLASVRLIYCLTLDNTANMMMMLEKLSNINDKFSCSIYSIAATLILNSKASNSTQILGKLNGFPKQTLKFVTRYYGGEEDLIQCIIKTIDFVSTKSSYFFTFQDLKDQLDFRPKVAQAANLKHRLFGRTNQTLSSLQFSNDSHIQLVHQFENFKNKVESKFGDNHQYYHVFLEIVRKTIQFFCGEGQLKLSANEWQSRLATVYDRLKYEPFLLAKKLQLQQYLHHIKLMMFYHYCQ